MVDSEPASARQTLATLVAAGYECKSFVECETAVATLQESGADVIVADFASAEERHGPYSQSQNAFAGNGSGSDGSESRSVSGGGCDASRRVRLPHQADQHR